MKWLKDFYVQLWYHTEFWLTPVDRRPYTFIMRDWMYAHVLPAATCCIIAFGLLAWWHSIAAIILAVMCGLLLGHLIWGTKYIENEQESPEYTEPGDGSHREIGNGT